MATKKSVPDEPKEIEAVVAKEVKAEVPQAEAKVNVELKALRGGVHTVYMSKGVVRFVNGLAKVEMEIAKELKELGLVK